MEKKEPLTNEAIREKFKNQFELVNYAIKLSEQMIRRGTDSENVAVTVIDDIDHGRDKFDEVLFVSKEVIIEPQVIKNAEPTGEKSKSGEKKKARRLLV